MKTKAQAYDARNSDDYVQLTERIAKALEKIETDLKQPATRENLARLAECSIKTLYNREIGIPQLKLIKNARKAAKQAALSERLQSSPNETTDIVEAMTKQIKNLQEEVGSLFFRIQTLEEDLQKANDLNDTLDQKLKASAAPRLNAKREIRDNIHSGDNVLELSAVRPARLTD